MEKKELKGYLDLIKIKTLNGYYKYIGTFFLIILLSTLVVLGLSPDSIKNYSIVLDEIVPLTSLGLNSLLIANKYIKNKKEFIANNDIKFETSVKECYDILKKEEIIKNNAPNNKIDRYYIDPEMYMTSKGKKLIRKR